jgi:hypothetical protein
MPINPKSWAESFTAELIVAGEHVPLDRVVARHSEAFTELRGLGMTWRGIAQLLVRAGARRADGSLISSDQLRVSYARVGDKRDATYQKPKRSPAKQPFRATTDAPPLAAADVAQDQKCRPTVDRERPLADKDVSGSEIDLALSRLSKISAKELKK